MAVIEYPVLHKYVILAFNILVLVHILKIKIGRRTHKSAADDPKIFTGCISNLQNITFWLMYNVYE